MTLTPLPSIAMPASGNLAALVDDTWTRMTRSLDGKWPPWALPMLATHSPNGPRARVLALRAADPTGRTLVFHCDARSDKVREIGGDPRVGVIFWDPADGVEARFAGRATVHREDDVASAAWRSVSPLRRLASAGAQAPGSVLGSPQRLDDLPTGEVDGFANFAVLHVEVDALDWLWVGADDLRRASFAWTGADWEGTWTVP